MFLLKPIVFNELKELFYGCTCDDSLIEEMCALMELRFIVFLHITNRPAYFENTRL